MFKGPSLSTTRYRKGIWIHTYVYDWETHWTCFYAPFLKCYSLTFASLDLKDGENGLAAWYRGGSIIKTCLCKTQSTDSAHFMVCKIFPELCIILEKYGIDSPQVKQCLRFNIKNIV